MNVKQEEEEKVSSDIIDQKDHQFCLVNQTERQGKMERKECKRETVLVKVSRLPFHFMFPVLVSVSVSGDPLTKGRVQVRCVGVSFHFVFLPVVLDKKWSGGGGIMNSKRDSDCILYFLLQRTFTFIQE